MGRALADSLGFDLDAWSMPHAATILGTHATCGHDTVQCCTTCQFQIVGAAVPTIRTSTTNNHGVRSTDYQPRPTTPCSAVGTTDQRPNEAQATNKEHSEQAGCSLWLYGGSNTRVSVLELFQCEVGACMIGPGGTWGRTDMHGLQLVPFTLHAEGLVVTQLQLRA